MPAINIPEKVFPGLHEISLLTKDQLASFASFLENLKISINYNDVFDDLEEFISQKLSVKNSESVVQAIISFGDLIKPIEINPDDLALNLASSFKELSPNGITDAESEVLKSNLKFLFEASNKLRIFFRAIDSAFENDNIFILGNINPDVRFVFNVEPKDENQYAFILHKLHIKYKQSSVNKDIFLTLDSEDLQSLKDSIEAALKHQAIIKENNLKNLTFINS